MSRPYEDRTTSESIPDNRTYWHGGVVGLQPGDALLNKHDAQEAGLDPALHDHREPAVLGRVTRADRVYFASDVDMARAFAYYCLVTLGDSVVSRGTLYRVHPVGQIEPDPDFAGEVSWCASGAIVLEAVEEDVRMRYRDAVRATGRFSAWEGGRPMYLHDGRMSVSQSLEQLGVTQEELDAVVRPWTSWEDAAGPVALAFGRRHR